MNREKLTEDLYRVLHHRIYRWIIPIFLLIPALVFVLDSSKLVPVATCITLIVLVYLAATVSRSLGCGMSLIG